MRNIIVGTAGHIDHGKTALVKALTGMDADRLAEEKRRGITIDLGFAHVDMAGFRVGFVDVPGHERFVKNMLAGATGIDVVLFVIAADESIKPQTREHLDICRLLGIERGVVALTKADLVDDEIVDLVRLEVEELAAGSFLAGAPCVAVSSRTGMGLEGLRAALADECAKAATRSDQGPARLPIDRAFTLRGFGTVVTGTLVSGTIGKEQELELLPGGRRLRVRGVECYGAQVSSALPGSRTAVNLPGIETSEIARGMCLVETGEFEATRLVDCELDLLASARRLKNRAPVHFHSGTAEVEATVNLLGREGVEPGERVYARLRLREPCVLGPGDRFILRQFSPVVTIAGGRVIDAAAPLRMRTAVLRERLAALAGVDVARKVALLLAESANGAAVAALARRLGAPANRIVAEAKDAGAAVLPEQWMVSKSWTKSTRENMVRLIREFHAQNPLAAGMPKSDLKAALLADAPAFLLEAVLAGATEIVAEGERVRHRTHRVLLNDEEQAARARIASAFEQAGLTAPSADEVLATAGLDAARSAQILRMLLKDGVLVRVSNELILHSGAIERIRRLLGERQREPFTVSTFKEWTGVSRKYAIPLLEYLDRQHLTVRDGDLRRVA